MPNLSYFKSKEERNKWYRNYRKKNRLMFRLYNKEYNKQWRKENGYHNEYKWQHIHNLEFKAIQIFRTAIINGKIEKQPCVICQKSNTWARHLDYSNPLKVVFLCPVHHKQYRGFMWKLRLALKI